MNEPRISVTAAARGFSDLINRIRYRGESAVLVKNGSPVARIAPFTADAPSCTAAGLADRLPDFELPAEDAERFADQLSEGRWD